jgi:Winged helix DNA-binding domain
VRAWIDKVWSVARPAIVEGLVCYGPDSGNEITLLRTDRWLPKQKPVSPESAQPSLVRAYLRAYGPASARDFAHWSGISMKEVAALWKCMEGEFSEVELEDRKACIPKEDAKALAESKLRKAIVRLLPSFDVFLLAQAAKSHLVPGSPLQNHLPQPGLDLLRSHVERESTSRTKSVRQPCS